jgi:hypothetical protein
MIFLEDLAKPREAAVCRSKGKPYPKAVKTISEFALPARSFLVLEPGVESAGSGPFRPISFD